MKVHTSKITFIELLKRSPQITKQPRTIYKNLETLQQQKLITYNNHLITFTKTGLEELKKIEQELIQIQSLNEFFKQTQKTKRKLQTVIEQNITLDTSRPNTTHPLQKRTPPALPVTTQHPEP